MLKKKLCIENNLLYCIYLIMDSLRASNIEKPLFKITQIKSPINLILLHLIKKRMMIV